MRFFVGTYTNDNRSAGIYSVSLDEKSGELGQPELAAKCSNPSFLALSPDGTRLYATAEVPSADGTQQGGLRAFHVTQGKGALTEFSALPLAASGTSTHVSVSPDGKAAFSVHYNAAWVASVRLDAQGALFERASLLTHAGKTGPNTKRQEKPHAHSIILSPDGRHAYVCDLGLDLVQPYLISPTDASLKALAPAASEPGDGPRHSRFSHDGRHLYVVNELTGSMGVYLRDTQEGTLSRLQTVSLLEPGFTGSNTSAEVQLHPNGRHLYATSRGPDIITVLERSEQDGLLKVLQRLPSGGRHPRHFALSPDGRWLVCANRDTDSLNVFAVDPTSGTLRATGFSAVVPQAVCVLFAP